MTGFGGFTNMSNDKSSATNCTKPCMYTCMYNSICLKTGIMNMFIVYTPPIKLIHKIEKPRRKIQVYIKR